MGYYYFRERRERERDAQDSGVYTGRFESKQNLLFSLVKSAVHAHVHVGVSRTVLVLNMYGTSLYSPGRPARRPPC